MCTINNKNQISKKLFITHWNVNIIINAALDNLPLHPIYMKRMTHKVSFTAEA